MRKALSDADKGVRAGAAWALGEMGPAAKSAVPELRRAISDPGKSVRSEAEGALKKIEHDGSNRQGGKEGQWAEGPRFTQPRASPWGHGQLRRESAQRAKSSTDSRRRVGPLDRRKHMDGILDPQGDALVVIHKLTTPSALCRW